MSTQQIARSGEINKSQKAEHESISRPQRSIPKKSKAYIVLADVVMHPINEFQETAWLADRIQFLDMSLRAPLLHDWLVGFTS